MKLSLLLFLLFALRGDWVVFETKDCKISFPQEPTAQTQTIPSPIGALKVQMYLYEVPDSIQDDNLVYGLSQIEYPDTVVNSGMDTSKLNRFFRGTVDGAVSNIQGTLLSETDISLNGYPGRAFRASLQGGAAILTMRSYLVKNRVSALETITLPQKDSNASVQRFFGSFVLKP